MFKLSLVLLAYKSEYLRQTLYSINCQSNKNFEFYIFNDNSPDHNIEEIIYDTCTELKYKYLKWNYNLGGNDLVAHWNRCVLKTDSDFVWLVCDDDIIPHDAVERFYNFISTHSRSSLLRFNLAVIDVNSNVKYVAPQHPLIETSYDFAIRRLNRNCTSSLSEYIFSRKAFDISNGFVNFPLGWASDDATWIKFGFFNDIKTIPGLPVQWRNDGQNISSDIGLHKTIKKIKSSKLFVVFAKTFLNVPNSVLIDWLKFQYGLVGKSTSTFSIIISFISVEYIIKYLKFRNERKNISRCL